MSHPILDDLAPDLMAVEFVKWDRFTVGEWFDGLEYVTVYGWIDREDLYKDFVVVMRWETGHTYFTTSSAERTHDVQQALFPDATPEDHNDCKRVEEHVVIPNAVRLRHDGGFQEGDVNGNSGGDGA